jgi:hypothetical protein
MFTNVSEVLAASIIRACYNPEESNLHTHRRENLKSYSVETDRHFMCAYCPHHQGISTSETSVNFSEIAWHNIPEDSHLHTRRREKLESHKNRLKIG